MLCAVTTDDRTQRPATGDAGALVLAWFGGGPSGWSAEARAVARRRLLRSGFGADAALVDDVVADAACNVVARSARGPIRVDNPAAYGTTVIRNVVSHLVRGREVPVGEPGEHLDDLRPGQQVDASDPIELLHGTGHADGSTVDELRLALERLGGPAPQVAASLGYLTFTMHPEDVPVRSPRPRAGSGPDHAAGWPALWFAGVQDCFPADGADPRRRARARHIERVRRLVERARDRVVAEQEQIDV